MNLVGGLVDALDRLGGDIGTRAQDELHDAATELLQSSRAMLSAQEGERAPEFALPDAGGSTVRLSDLLGLGPVVLTFFRGGWCGYCSAYLGVLQRALPAFRAAGAATVAISPQSVVRSRETAARLALDFLLVSDHDNAVARRYGLVFRLPEAFRRAYEALGIDLPAANGTETFELPIPATYVIAPDGKIAYASADADYTRRPDPGVILSRLQAIAAGRAPHPPSPASG
jgi:peroxiredoxin